MIRPYVHIQSRTGWGYGLLWLGYVRHGCAVMRAFRVRWLGE